MPISLVDLLGIYFTGIYWKRLCDDTSDGRRFSFKRGWAGV